MNKIYNIILYMLLSIPIYATNKACDFGIYELLCEQQVNPIGIDNEKPNFSWKISSIQRGFTQYAYQILVSDSEHILAMDKGNVWDTGKCKSEQSVLVEYKGKELESSTKYYWKVRIWDKKNVSDWSKTGSFITGIISEKDWNNAKWISLEKDDTKKNLYPGIHAPLVQNKIGKRMVGNYTLPIARRKIQIKKEIDNAIVNISGLGHFDLFVNGEKVSDHFLDAGWTNYAKTALYTTFDISEFLKKENVISVMFGNGFYNIPRERYFKQLISFGAPKLKLCLQINYKDGSKEQIISDEQWKFAESPITYSSIYGGEDYDATKEYDGWMISDFDDNNWKSPVISDKPIKLIAQKSAPLTVRDTLNVMKKYKNSRGNWIYDLGQNFSGIVNIKVKGDKGNIIRLRPGELLNNDSTVNQRASGGPYYWQYTLKSGKYEQWSPRFTYYGFRYVEVSGTDEVDNFELVGLHTTNSAKETGKFSCSLPIFNKTYDLIDWSMRSNLSSILTDCPHREKLGWLEVAHLMQYSLQYRYDLVRFYHQMMLNMSDSQTDKGTIPSIAPEYVRFADGFEDSPEWGSAFIIIPWYIYKWYGDESLLKGYYPQMKKYLEYLSSRANNNIIEYGLGDWFDLGPKNPGYSQLTSNGVTATGIYYYDISIMKEIANLLDLSDDYHYYNTLMNDVKFAYNNKYYNEENGYYDRNSQTANAISLLFGLVDDANYNKVYNNLRNDIISRGYALTSGDIGYRYLLKVLEDNNDYEIIYKMNTKYDVPGYGWQLAYGATSLTESWQAYGFVSNNHCMLGHLMEWFFAGLGGIRQNESSVAYKHIEIKPQMPRGVKFATAEYDSPYGLIRCDWKREGNLLRVNVTVPANTECTMDLPFNKDSKLREGGIIINDNKWCNNFTIKDNRIKIKIKSGNYSFELQNF
ncbi:family 78 glycoside hydrolase catalytic domain [uncultured Bacteroides sp.]|uniref:family 78 glycoside hydrolase catalytic domain n=1 Tax=uncultured Bacteroides sp. TaxID=162156 RepID=UPI0026129727|nr:family 78 glycoside hydrolase catalytic domain [uncultured Bacteroides sp.]